MISGKVYLNKTNNPQSGYYVYLSDSKGNLFNKNPSYGTYTNNTGLFSINNVDGANYISVKCGGAPIVKKIGSNRVLNFDVENCGSIEIEEVVINDNPHTSNTNDEHKNDDTQNHSDNSTVNVNSSSDSGEKNKKKFKDLSTAKKISVYTAGIGVFGLLTSFFIKN